MGYVEKHLLPAETVVHRAALHWTVLIGPLLAALVLVALAVVAFLTGLAVVGAVLAPLALVPLLVTWITYRSSEFAVTDKRVVIKVGWIQRTTLELLLAKVEAIGVDQGFLGRLLNFGTITVTGTGGTDERFARIGDPLEFRRQVHAQVTSRERGVLDEDGSHHPAPRDERDCPFCAERVLKRALVCKHCGRDIEPVAT